MAKNIYEALGFKPSSGAIYPDAVIQQASAIFASLPDKLSSLKALAISKAVFEETYAISTAEYSELTEKEAESVFLTPETEARLKKYQDDEVLTDRQKYERLEFENIESVENNISPFGFKDITVGFIKKLHYDLTIGLDRYTKTVGVSKYHSGSLRQSNSTKIGKIRPITPPDHKRIMEFLKLLLKEFSNRKQIGLKDILEFHVLFYTIHPFQNGNKRVVRLLESMLLHHYGYGAERTLSLAAYYDIKKDDSHFFLLHGLRKKEVTPFVNFALRGYLLSGHAMFSYTSDLILKQFTDNFRQFTELTVKETKRPDYKAALRSIVSLEGLFTHGDFVADMKKRGYTLGVSQMILKDLRDKGILAHQDGRYFIHRMDGLQEVMEKLLKLFFEYGISVGELDR